MRASICRLAERQPLPGGGSILTSPRASASAASAASTSPSASPTANPSVAPSVAPSSASSAAPSASSSAAPSERLSGDGADEAFATPPTSPEMAPAAAEARRRLGRSRSGMNELKDVSYWVIRRGAAGLQSS